MKHSLLLKWCIALLLSIIVIGNANALTITTGGDNAGSWAGNTYTVTNNAGNINLTTLQTRLNSGNVTINITGDVNIGAFTINNTGATTYTLNITGSGNITTGNIDLSGAAGTAPTASSSVQRSGKNGYNLSITAGGNVTISGIINTSGGNAVDPVSLGEYSTDREAGAGGNAGNITITGNKVDITSAASANGGNGGRPNNGSGSRKGGNGGNAGNITIKSSTSLTVNAINVNGGNGSNNHQKEPTGAGGKAGNVTIVAEENISTTGAITANAGHTGANGPSTSDDEVTGVPLSQNGGNVKITSGGGAVTIGGTISANGGNGTGQATNTMIGTTPNRNKSSTDGGKGGTVEISSCANLTVTTTITVNGGAAGIPVGSPNGGGTHYNTSGSGGAGGSVTITSSNGNVATAQIQANGNDGANISSQMNGDNDGTNADHGGNAGAGGQITVSAPQGTIIANNAITAKGGNGGNHIGEGCGGSGAKGGTVKITASGGNQGAISSQVQVTGGSRGTNNTAKPAPCSGQTGSSGSSTVTISPVTPPTLSSPLSFPCTGGTLTATMLDAKLSDPNNVVAVPHQWETKNGTGQWVAMTLPYTVTSADNGKEIRLMNGCVEVGILTLDVPSCGCTKPTASISSNKTSICEGESATLTVTLTGTPNFNFKVTGNISGEEYTETGHSSTTWTKSVSPTADVTYSISGLADNSGCTADPVTSTVGITVNKKPTVTSNLAFSAFCEGDAFSATTTPTVTNETSKGFQIETTAGSGTYTTLSSTLSLADNGKKIRYFATNSCGTVYSNEVTLTVNPKPTVTSNLAFSGFCEGDAFSATTTPTTTNADTENFEIETVAGSGIYTTLPAILSASDNGKKVRYYAENTCDRVTSNEVIITVSTNLVPSVSISPNSGSVCAGTSVKYTATETNGGTNPNYEWFVDGVSKQNGTSNTFNYTPDNAEEISCEITSDLSCATPTTASNAVIASVTPNVTPSVSITAIPSGNICEGTPVKYTATETNGGTNPNYEWFVDGVSKQNGTSNIFNYTPNDAEEISCEMTSNETCVTPATASDAVIASVMPNVTPSVSITAIPSGNICEGTPVKYTATETNGGTNPNYEWFVDGVSKQNGTSNIFNYEPANSEKITCKMTSNETCVTPSATATSNVITADVTTKLTPSVSISANPASSICAGTPVKYTATATNDGTNPNYEWFVDGVSKQSGTSNTFNYTPNDTEEISCEITSSETCVTIATAISNIITASVTPNVTPSVIISDIPSGSICAETSVQYTATATNGGTNPIYEWFVNGVSKQSGTGNTFNYTPVNNEIISCQMTSNETCVTPSATATSNIITTNVTSNVTPSVSISAIPAGIICAGTPVQYFATPAYGGTPSYEWFVDGVLQGETSSAFYYIPNNGEKITCEMTSSLICVNLATAISNIITANVKDRMDFILSKDFWICPGMKAPLLATFVKEPTGPYRTMWWKKGASDTDWEFITGALETVDFPVENTVYRFTSTQEGGICPYIDSFRVFIADLPKITEIEEVNKKVFEVRGSGGTQPFTYSMDIDIDREYRDENTFKVEKVGRHIAYIKDFYGCKTDSIFTVFPVDLIFPKYFMPNSTVIRQTRWYIENIDYYPEIELLIFDRFGKELERITNSLDWRGWDGIYLNKNMPSDDYWYLINIREINFKQTGHFTLLRD